MNHSTVPDVLGYSRIWGSRTLVAQEGRATEASLDVSALGIDSAHETSLVEDDLGPVAVKQGKLTVKLRPFGFLTLRLLRGAPPASAVAVQATAAGDGEGNLTWPANAGVTYNVYRSDDPAAPATDYTLIARVTGGSFTDRGLNVRTDYTYRVAALNDGNRQGALSPAVVVQTSAQNRTPPRPVEELGIVRRSPTSLFVYWRRNAEPDVAKHYVYRSERPGFDPKDMEPVAALSPDPDHFLQVYADQQVKPGQTYFYQTLSEDWAGNRQTRSPEVAVTTPKS
jgi:fibronectin type 3 domain-containing protein